jgi:hypothetical protein
VAIVQTDVDGRFQINGLAEGKYYALVAGGGGGMTIDETDRCLTGTTPIDLTLNPVFSAVVHVRQADGAALPVSDGVYGQGATWIPPSIPQETVEPIIGLPSAYFLIVKMADWSWSQASVTDQLILVSSSLTHSKLEGIQFDVDVPGFFPATRELVALPISDTIPNYTIELRSTGVSRGVLKVRCVGTSSGMRPDSPTEYRLGVLSLVGESGDNITIAVAKPCGPDRLYDGIPYGIYHARFKFNDWYRDTPPLNEAPATIVIGAAPSVFTIDATGSPLIQPLIKDSDGHEYTGQVTLRLFNKSGTRFLAFRTSPYVIDGVAPGKYWLAIDRIPGVDRLSQLSITFEAVSDELVQPELRIIR